MAMKASTAKLIASDFVTPDLKPIRRFIAEAVADGAIAVLIATIIGLLARMRDLNRLQLELPFVLLATPEPSAPSAPSANDTSPGSDDDNAEGEKRKPRGRKKPDQKNRDAHGRPKFPEHIPRVEGDVELVTGDARVCPHCDGGVGCAGSFDISATEQNLPSGFGERQALFLYFVGSSQLLVGPRLPQGPVFLPHSAGAGAGDGATDMSSRVCLSRLVSGQPRIRMRRATGNI